MRFGSVGNTLLVTFNNENVRSISDARCEFQTEITVRTSGTYTDTQGNKTVYTQDHVGSAVIRIEANGSTVLTQKAVEAVRNGGDVSVLATDVKVTEQLVSGNFYSVAGIN